MSSIIPDIYIGTVLAEVSIKRVCLTQYNSPLDTMGYAFTFAFIRIIGVSTRLTYIWSGAGSIPIGAYVHYPTISTNMLEGVHDRETSSTNDEAVSRNNWRRDAKFMWVALIPHTIRCAS